MTWITWTYFYDSFLTDLIFVFIDFNEVLSDIKKINLE